MLRCDYKIVTANALDKLEREVNQMLKTGWRPQGGVSSITIKYSESTNTDNALREIRPRVFQYSQALILETESFELKEKTYLDC